MSEKFLFGVLLFFCGIFCVVGAIGDHDWFLNTSKVSSWVNVIGRDCTRILYTIIGLIVTIMGIILMMGFNL